MGKNARIASIFMSLVFVTSACTSKFEDKEPDSQSTNGFTLEGNMNANEDLDKKLARLEESAEKIRKLIKAFRKIKSSELGEDNYTQIDFILDANEQLGQAPSRKQGETYIRESSFKVKMNGVSAECSRIDTRLETMSLGGKVQTELDSTGAQIDGLIYSVRTCKSGDRYIPIATVTFTSQNTKLEFNNENIKLALVHILDPVIQANSNCVFGVDAQHVLARAECTNLDTKISETGKILFDNILYDRYADIRFSVNGKLLDNNVAKGDFFFALDKDGKPSWKMQKLP